MNQQPAANSHVAVFGLGYVGLPSGNPLDSRCLLSDTTSICYVGIVDRGIDS